MRRGRRPLPGRLHLVTGTFRQDRHAKAAPDSLPVRDPLPKPDWLRGGVSDAWDRFITPAGGFLDVYREPAAVAFCELWHEFQAWPARFPASKHALLRAYMADLGLSGARK